MEDVVGFEPTLRELQSRALPLGYTSKEHTNYIKKYNPFQYILWKKIKKVHAICKKLRYNESRVKEQQKQNKT